MRVQSHLVFDGRCDDPIDFCKSALSAEFDMMMRFKDSHEPPQAAICPPDSGDKIMHASLRIGNAVAMASDGNCAGKSEFKGFSFAISVKTEADCAFAALAQGGQVQMPLVKTFFSPRFELVSDRFGVASMIDTNS